MKRISLLLAVVLAVLIPHAAWAQTLYGADGAGGNLSQLLILDPLTGDVVEIIGPIGFAVTGLAFHPITGDLYGTTGGKSSLVHPSSLIRIDVTTGAGVLIGSLNRDLGLRPQPAADITFAGETLYGWLEPFNAPVGEHLVTINLTTGQATSVGTSPGVGGETRGSGLAFTTAGPLYFAGTGDSHGTCFVCGHLHTLNPATGAPIGEVDLIGGSGDDDPFPAMASDLGSTLYAVHFRTGGSALVWELVTINAVTGQITVIGPTIDKLDAIAFGSSAEPLTPEEQVGQLIAAVEALVDGGVLNAGNANALTAKLAGALKSLDKDKTVPAANQVLAFINQVNALVSSGRLTPEEAQPLIDAANDIFDAILNI